MGGYLQRKVHRVGFYLRGGFRQCVPRRLHQRRLARARRALQARPIDEAVRQRINYYNRLTEPFTTPDRARAIEEISLDEGSYYYFDLQEYLLTFPPGLRVAYAFGDIVEIPAVPKIVKSRPLSPGNHNAVLLKLDKLRHYKLYKSNDPKPFRAKRPRAVWRGTMNNRIRADLVDLYGKDRRHDIGYTGTPKFEYALAPKEHLSLPEQLENRYVISVEGNDVATNLKWIFASNSLCLMPKPKFETWYMEGTLEAGRHYVEIRPDFADLEEKIGYCEAHPDEAEAIIDHAKAFHRQFLNPEREALIGLMVLQKYFELSGQLPRESFSADLFRG